MALRKNGCGKTDIGMERANNEDAVFVMNEKIGPLPNLYIVADGMGGHNAGEVASGKSIEFFIDYLASLDPPEPEPDIAKIIEDGVLLANERVFDLAENNPGQRGMGTTFSACSIGEPGRLFFGHVGDSRIYVASKDGMKQITTDHSYVGEMLRSGDISPEQAKSHPRRNMLTRALGTDSRIVSESGSVALDDGDVVILCSDGLTAMLSNDEILEIARRPLKSEAEKAGEMVGLANKKGGLDNISVIIV